MDNESLSLSALYRTRNEVIEQRLEIRLREDLEHVNGLLTQNRRDPQLYLKLVELHDELHEHKLAAAVIEEGLSCCEPNRKLYRLAVAILASCSRTHQAIEVARMAARHFPGDGRFRMQEALMLPILYDAPEEIGRWRERYTLGLNQLPAQFGVDTPEERRTSLHAIGGHTNFYLAYQAQNDRPLQEQYGRFVHRIMAASYPDWTEPVPAPPSPAGGRIRVGYISTNFHYHSTSWVSMGWLRECNRRDIEQFAYYLGSRVDWVTDEARRACDHFHHIPGGDLEGICRAIQSDRLHVLVFIEIGLQPIMTQLAALRLAPIQCATLAHPITTGLPTVDYFISSDLMEPPDAQDHYSERLVRLPGIGSCRPKPIIPRALTDQARSRFGLREDAAVYLCCQNTFKYLPQHDRVLAEIARRVPASQFVFLVYNDVLSGVLRARLSRAFQAAGLEADRHCLFHPRLPTYVDYWNLHLVSDVFLDSLDYSGFTTTMEAVACGMPVVTLPGEFCRGRQTYAILKQLGVTGTIARDEADYIEIAVRLGCDRDWRAEVVQRMIACHNSLFWDTRSVRAIEEFYRSAVQEAAKRSAGTQILSPAE